MMSKNHDRKRKKTGRRLWLLLGFLLGIGLMALPPVRADDQPGYDFYVSGGGTAWRTTPGGGGGGSTSRSASIQVNCTVEASRENGGLIKVYARDVAGGIEGLNTVTKKEFVTITCGGCGDGRLDRAKEKCDWYGDDTCDKDCNYKPGICENGFDKRTGKRCGDIPMGGLCGNRTKEGIEECDDGNTNSGDGCSAACRIERCGNRIVDVGEECDGGRYCSPSCEAEIPDACRNFSSSAPGASGVHYKGSASLSSDPGIKQSRITVDGFATNVCSVSPASSTSGLLNYTVTFADAAQPGATCNFNLNAEVTTIYEKEDSARCATWEVTATKKIGLCEAGKTKTNCTRECGAGGFHLGDQCGAQDDQWEVTTDSCTCPVACTEVTCEG